MNKEQFMEAGKSIIFSYEKTKYKARYIGGNVYVLYPEEGFNSLGTIILEDKGFKMTTHIGDVTLQSELILYSDVVLFN